MHKEKKVLKIKNTNRPQAIWTPKLLLKIYIWDVPCFTDVISRK